MLIVIAGCDIQIWAASWQNQQNGMCASSEDSDQSERRLRSTWASAQSDQSSQSPWRKLGSLATHWADSEDSDQTWRMPRLIWVFAGRTFILLGLSWGGSYFVFKSPDMSHENACSWKLTFLLLFIWFYCLSRVTIYKGQGSRNPIIGPVTSQKNSDCL